MARCLNYLCQQLSRCLNCLCQQLSRCVRCYARFSIQTVQYCYQHISRLSQWPNSLLAFLETSVCQRFCKLNKRWTAISLLALALAVFCTFSVYTCPELHDAMKYATPLEAVNKTLHWSHICEVSVAVVCLIFFVVGPVCIV